MNSYCKDSIKSEPRLLKLFGGHYIEPGLYSGTDLRYKLGDRHIFVPKLTRRFKLRWSVNEIDLNESIYEQIQMAELPAPLVRYARWFTLGDDPIKGEG
jgi:hypothetical protein